MSISWSSGSEIDSEENESLDDVVPKQAAPRDHDRRESSTRPLGVALVLAAAYQVVSHVEEEGHWRGHDVCPLSKLHLETRTVLGVMYSLVCNSSVGHAAEYSNKHS